MLLDKEQPNGSRIMQLRTYRPSDCRKVYNTVHTINAKDYSLEQLNAWAPKDFDERQWDMSFRKHYTIVAEDNNEIIGFGDIDRNGYLDRLYVHALHQGEGVAAAICDLLEEYVDGPIMTESSITARPFLKIEDTGWSSSRLSKDAECN